MAKKPPLHGASLPPSKALCPIGSPALCRMLRARPAARTQRFADALPGTVRRELGVLRAAINYAHRNGILTRVVAIHLPDRPPARDRWLTRSAAARLVAGALGFTFVHCSDIRTRREKWVVCDRERAHARLHLPLFILLGLYTGARKEAILSLRWLQVDLEGGRIDFNTPGAQRTNKRYPHSRKVAGASSSRSAARR
jgi:integrase